MQAVLTELGSSATQSRAEQRLEDEIDEELVKSMRLSIELRYKDEWVPEKVSDLAENKTVVDLRTTPSMNAPLELYVLIRYRRRRISRGCVAFHVPKQPEALDDR